MARLYHLTCIGHFPKIMADGFLKTVESNIGTPDMFEPDPNDPDYDTEHVLVWPKRERGKPYKRIPMMVPGPLLKTIEEKQEMFTRVTREELEAMGPQDDQMTVSVVVGWEPLDHLPDVKYGEHVGPDVVWLTSDPTPKQAWQSLNDALDIRAQKSQILFVVEVPDEDVKKWSEWAFEQGISKFWYEALDDDDGSADNWYVVDREIPKAEWVAIYMAQSGDAIWLNPDLHEVDPDDLNEKGLIKAELKNKYEQQYPIPLGYFAARLQTEV